ncbi:MAG TPA: HD domain-containing protein [Clostridiales bacterium]|nr:HD domain-containing protein [Clostridiales bacterium]
MGLHNYLMTVRKLNNMGRWSTDFMHQRATVSEHSFFVAQIGQMLALIEEQNGNKVDWCRLFRKLLNHDVVEAMTGDIISTVKYKNAQLRDMLSALEKEIVEENLLASIEEPYKSIYREILFDGKDSTLEGEILRCADYIDAIVECINEVKLNNLHPFVDKFHSIVQRLAGSSLVSVQYFIKQILPGMIEGCSELENYDKSGGTEPDDQKDEQSDNENTDE